MRYPYCYGYWKKYADMEKKHNNEDDAEKVSFSVSCLAKRGLYFLFSYWWHIIYCVNRLVWALIVTSIYKSFKKKNTKSRIISSLPCLDCMFISCYWSHDLVVMIVIFLFTTGPLSTIQLIVQSAGSSSNRECWILFACNIFVYDRKLPLHAINCFL